MYDVTAIDWVSTATRAVSVSLSGGGRCSSAILLACLMGDALEGRENERWVESGEEEGCGLLMRWVESGEEEGCGLLMRWVESGEEEGCGLLVKKPLVATLAALLGRWYSVCFISDTLTMSWGREEGGRREGGGREGGRTRIITLNTHHTCYIVIVHVYICTVYTREKRN